MTPDEYYAEAQRMDAEGIPLLADEPQHECESWLFQVVTGGTGPVEENGEWLRKVDAQLVACAMLADNELYQQVWPTLWDDPEVRFWAVVLDGDEATIKAVVHDVVERAYEQEAERYRQ
jgi:hypothetical protein